MGTEASKTRSVWGPVELSLFRGEGIDIGCGPDPIFPNAVRFDQDQGDANVITRHVDRQFNWVFSSHCLEHMHDPRSALREWWALVKPGGHLIVLVPDEDLYEQGHFPSVFNHDHKWTFTSTKGESWSPRSVNCTDLCRELGAKEVRIERQDRGYDHLTVPPKT